MTGTIVRSLLIASASVDLSIVMKATMVLALGVLGTRLAHRARAAVRHLVLATMFGVLLLLPLAVMLMPRMPIAIAAAPGHDVSPSVSWTPAIHHVRSDVPAPSAPIVGQSTGRTISLVAVARAVWALGVIVCLMPIAVAAWRLRDLRRRGVPWRAGDARVRTLAITSGFRRSVDARLSEEVVVPMTYGPWHPVILLPHDVHAWSGEDLQLALVHELEHVRRMDSLVMGVARATCALYWFHPLIWLAFRDLRLESERACDDAVLGVAADPTAYAEQLVSVAARMIARAPRMALAMVSRGELSVRVSAMLDRSQPRGPAGMRSTTAIGTLAVLVLLILGGLTATDLSAQRLAGATPALAFQTVSIKVSQFAAGIPESRVFMGPRDQFVSSGTSLGALIRSAYHVSPYEMSGGPDWIESVPFDVVAQAPQNTSREQQALMLQTLLADRFKLTVHTERRTRPAYTLVRSPRYSELGPQLVRSTRDCVAEARLDFHDTLKVVAAQWSLCGDVRLIPHRLIATAVDLSRFAVELPSVGAVDRTVLDRTGLTGAFDVDLSWTPQPDNLGYSTNPPSIFVAVESQLGLALEPANEPIEVLVIDGAERPAEH